MHRWKWDEVNRWWNRVQMEKKKKKEKKKMFLAALHTFWVEKKQTLGADRWCRWSKFNLADAYQEFTPRARTFRVTLDSALSLSFFLSPSPVSIFRSVPYIMNTINLLRSFARWQQVGGVSGGLAVSDRDWLMFLWSAHSVRSPLISPTQEKWLDGGVAGETDRGTRGKEGRMKRRGERNDGGTAKEVTVGNDWQNYNLWLKMAAVHFTASVPIITSLPAPKVSSNNVLLKLLVTQRDYKPLTPTSPTTQ